MSKEYIQIAFDFENQDQLEILVAQLSNLGFDGFNEEEAATSINNGVGMSSVLGTSAGLGEGAGHCKTFILQQDYIDNNIEVFVTFVFFLKKVAEYVLKDTHHSGPIDIL